MDFFTCVLIRWNVEIVTEKTSQVFVRNLSFFKKAIKCEWKIIVSPVLQRTDQKRIDRQSSGEVKDTSSQRFFSNEVKGEMAHCICQDAKGNVAHTFIYLIHENSLWILQNPSTGYISYDSIFVQFIGKPLCSYTYSGSIWRTDLDRKITVLNLSILYREASKENETRLTSQLCSHQRRILQLKFKF